MIALVGILLALFSILLVNEWLWKKKIIEGELARKSVHISIGTFGAFWPFFMPWQHIQIIALAAVIFIIFMRKAKVFNSIYGVKRRSWGDLIAPITIGVIAMFEPSKWIFAAAVLHIALADGLAAVIGTRYGKHNTYKVFWNTKSVIGTMTFWIVSLSILVWALVLNPPVVTGLTLPVLLWLPLMAASVENISPFGFDNLFVPLLVVGALGPLQFIG